MEPYRHRAIHGEVLFPSPVFPSWQYVINVFRSQGSLGPFESVLWVGSLSRQDLNFTNEGYNLGQQMLYVQKGLETTNHLLLHSP